MLKGNPTNLHVLNKKDQGRVRWHADPPMGLHIFWGDGWYCMKDNEDDQF